MIIYMHQTPVLPITTSGFVTIRVLSKKGALNHFKIPVSRLGYVRKLDFTEGLFLFETEPILLVVSLICMV